MPNNYATKADIEHLRTTKEYRAWVAGVKRRDKGCIISGDVKSREAHHIKDASNHPEEMMDIDNGITLSKEYHTAYHTKFLTSFKCKTSPETLIRFLKLVAIAKGVPINTFLDKAPQLKKFV